MGWQMGNFSHELVNPIISEEFFRHRFGGCGPMYVGEEEDCVRSMLHGNDEQRERAARSMPRYSYWSSSISSLTLALKDPSTRVKYFAARSLGQVSEDSKAAIPALIEALQDKNEFVRMTAAFSLGKFGRDALPTKPPIQTLLKDTNADVRACAKLALKQIDSGGIGKQANAAP